MSKRNVFRHGDTMITVETAPAIVEYGDILAATRVVPDDDNSDPPWEHCDGLEHTAVPERRMPDEAHAREMRGHCWTLENESVVIRIPETEDYGVYAYLRERGASKQVAREAVAVNRRRTLEYLCRLYRDGWQWWGVKCDFSVMGDDYGASLWGIDDDSYAEREVKQEIALEVAGQLEEAGFTVVGKPVGERGLSAQHFGTVVSTEGISKQWFRRVMTADRWREEWKRNMAAQNWQL